MPQSISCDAALSDLVLQAARQAIPANAGDYHLNAGIKNQPNLILLMALLDAARAVACAVADNAWDDCHPIPSDVAAELTRMAGLIGSDIITATQCPDASCWNDE